MEIRNNTNIPRLSFKADLSNPLRDVLINEALKADTGIFQLAKQVKRVKKWGLKSSKVDLSFDLNKNTQDLALYNGTLSSQYGASLPQRKFSVLNAFLDLKEEDIVKAEQKIRENVNNNKLDLISKATEDSAIAEKLTGKQSPTDEELAYAIDSLSEDEITNLRFGLNEKPVETGKLIDFNF